MSRKCHKVLIYILFCNIRFIFFLGVFCSKYVLGEETQILVTPYSFNMDSDTHQLHTTWEVKGSSISFICAFAKVSMMELSWTGESKELSSGTSWAVNCEEGEQGDKMVIEVDVTKFRVQPFRSYKVCISLEDSPTESHLDEVCTHLFSFEKYVPYMPMPEADVTKKEIEEANAISKDIENGDKEDVMSIFNQDDNSLDMHREEGTKSIAQELDALEKIPDNTTDRVRDENMNISEDIESVLKHQLSDIDNYVRDDFQSQYLELKHEIIEEFDQKFIQSSSDRPNLYMGIFVLMIVSLLLHD